MTASTGPGWALSDLRAVEEGTLSVAGFRATVLTGVAAVGCFLTTGFASRSAIGIMAWGLLLALWGRGFPGPAWLVQPASLAWLGLAVSQWSRGTPGIVALTEFAAGVMALQWVLVVGARPARHALILAGMIVLAVAAMSVNFLFPLGLLPLVAFLLRALWALAEPGPGPAGRAVARPAAWPGLVRGGLVFGALWIGMFYLIPRPDVLGIASGAAKQRLRGFSETLQLGEAGGLEDNPMVVMRVRPVVDDAPNRRRLAALRNTVLRGCSFLAYRQGGWSRQGYHSQGINLRRSGGELAFRGIPGDTRPEFELEILLESMEPPILFLPAHAVRLTSGLRFLWADTDGTLTVPFRRGGVEVYQTRVRIGPPVLQDFPVEGASFPRFITPFLDPGDSSGAIADLAQEVASGAPTLLGVAKAIQSHLQANYTYSVEGEGAPVRDPVSNFLLNSRRGSCEHFASAMVLMMRYLGLPARPVNGYLLTEWNDYGGFFTVRQRDAHSWVEVYFPGQGWIPFDPTPAGRPEPPLGWAAWLGAGEWWEWFEGFWFNYVYRFDRDIQMAGFRRMYQAVSGVWDGRLGGGWWLAAGLAMLVGAAWAVRRRVGGGQGRNGWLPVWYREFCAGLPVERLPWETPREFHRRLRGLDLWPADCEPLLADLEREVGRAVFGGEGEAAARRAAELIQALSGRAARGAGGRSPGPERSSGSGPSR
ncbi:MAG: DUF3488 domain-containing transglutaminase family protein [Candidatus Riflebacteria bacterium]|nr:DUF3488 domain-containing transglutaminase family protein [Candidatus Riflebacteria bacterium]